MTEDDLFRITSYFAQYYDEQTKSLANKLKKELKEYIVFIPCESFDESSAIVLVNDDTKKRYLPVFTLKKEMNRKYSTKYIIQKTIFDAIKMARDNPNNLEGILINPFTFDLELDSIIYNLL